MDREPSTNQIWLLMTKYFDGWYHRVERLANGTFFAEAYSGDSPLVSNGYIGAPGASAYEAATNAINARWWSKTR